MRTLAETLALALAALVDALFGIGRWLRDAIYPPSQADAWDAATADLQAAELRLAETEAEPAESLEPLGHLARRFLSGDESANIWTLPLRQQTFLIAARKAGVKIGAMTDDDLELHVTGRATAYGLPPLLDAQKLDAVRRAYVAREDDHMPDWEHADAYRPTPGWC